MTITPDRTAALVRGVRAQGGTVLEARRLLEALASDDEQRLCEARQRREDELLAIDLGFNSTDALGAALTESHGIAGGGVFPQDASMPEPRGVRAAVQQMEEARIAEEADNDFLAELLIDGRREQRSYHGLAEVLGTTPEDLEAMLEGARPSQSVDASATRDLRVAETIGVPAETLAEALDEVLLS